MYTIITLFFDSRAWYQAPLVIALGFLLDVCAGDPQWFPHPVRGIGFLTAKSEPVFRLLFKQSEYLAGAALVFFVICVSYAVIYVLLTALWYLHYLIYLAVSVLVCWMCICARCLRDETLKVYYKLKTGDIDGARRALSGIVGRDTENLDKEGIIRAAVETAAENLTDGVIAPVFYLALGGPPLGMLYKAVNTLDSMIGYKNERYLYFGRCAAKLDDAANWLPARITGPVVVIAARILKLDAAGAARIYRRDRLNHESPNSAHGEAAFAGALGIALAGGAFYRGQFESKPVIGDPLRKAELEDIIRAVRLMWASSALWTVIACLAAVVFHFALYKAAVH